MFRRRITDGVLNRLIPGWLKAGVMKEGTWQATEDGTPQGGIVSPLLANLYLKDVLDQWVEHEVKSHLQSSCRLIRYADDAVICFKDERDARRVYDVLHNLGSVQRDPEALAVGAGADPPPALLNDQSTISNDDRPSIIWRNRMP